MPYIATVTARYTRKFQIEKDDWIGLDMLVTLAVEEGEAQLVDPAEIRAEAFRQARESVMEQIAEARRERDEARARGRTEIEAPHTSAAAPAPAESSNGQHQPAPPATVAEAEQRFYARYGDIIGAGGWVAVQRYTGIRAKEPSTIKGWYAAAQAVRDRIERDAA